MIAAHRPTLILTIGLCLWLSGCASESFTVWPGFSDYFTRYPPAQQSPAPAQQALLEKYRPRIFKYKDQQGPIDFYRQYIANGTLQAQGKHIASDVTPQLLNKYVNDPTALFSYNGSPLISAPATVYGRVDYDSLNYHSNTYELQFLTYNLVFPASGMINGLGMLATAGLGIAGNLTDWHQLDHYVGLSVVLHQQQPVAIMLQQHNYQTTYVVGSELELPTDNRVMVDIALRSNELYLHQPQKAEHPAVSFISAKNIEFMISGDNKPMMAGFDTTNGNTEVQYTLQYLSPADAFYQFKGQLGKSRLLPGRDGPPGADYLTLPGLMPRAIRLAAGYRTDSLAHETDKISALFNDASFSINEDALERYIHDFVVAAGLTNR
ncbi:MAG: hypothetical protein AAF404_07280 [Pseudomonadota bacterium]